MPYGASATNLWDLHGFRALGGANTCCRYATSYKGGSTKDARTGDNENIPTVICVRCLFPYSAVLVSNRDTYRDVSA
jgi:hypothetical protein